MAAFFRLGSRTTQVLVGAAGLCLLALFTPAVSPAVERSTAATDARDAQRRQQTKADSDRRRAERERKIEQLRREMKLTEDRARSRLPPDMLKRAGLPSSASSRGSAAPALPPFNPASAPPAEECWKSYVAAARTATSMDQLMNYLPQKEQKHLRERQSQYDPREAAESQQRWRKKNPEMKESAITFLTNSPYVNALDHHKSIANKFREVLSAKSDGNKATIVVSTNSLGTSNGAKYPYSKATIEMIGEAGYWRIDTYNDSGWHYQEPPIAP